MQAIYVHWHWLPDESITIVTQHKEQQLSS